jgi:hypothetical protein
MKNLILFLTATCVGAWMWYNPLPPKVNAFIVAFFVTIRVYKELKK